MNLIENITAVFDRASQSEVESGMFWYPTAHRIALESGSVERGAGIIAALSPMMPWDRNVMLAREAWGTGTAHGGLTANVAKAQSILEGANPLDVLGGDKVRTFYRNIVSPWGDGVTIDRHAYDIATNTVNGNGYRGIGKRVYAELSEAYVTTASMLGIFPTELQAITWVVWRRELSENKGK